MSVANTTEHPCGILGPTTYDGGRRCANSCRPPERNLSRRLPPMADRTRRKPIAPPQRAMPLEMFSEEHRLEILQQVELPHPPEKWIYLGVLSSGKPSCRIESRAWYEWHWARGIDPDKIRPSLSASSRRAVIRRDGYVCGICGGDVEPGDVDIDHIKPFSKGGSDHLDNLRVSHSSCNRRRGAREDD